MNKYKLNDQFWQTFRFCFQSGHMKSQVKSPWGTCSQATLPRKEVGFLSNLSKPLSPRLENESLSDALFCQKSHSWLYWILAEKVTEIMLLDFFSSSVSRSLEAVLPLPFHLSSTAHVVPVAPSYLASQTCDILILMCYHSNCYDTLHLINT